MNNLCVRILIGKSIELNISIAELISIERASKNGEEVQNLVTRRYYF